MKEVIPAVSINESLLSNPLGISMKARMLK